MKKVLAMFLSLMLGIGVVACSKKEEVKQEGTSEEINYTEQYSVLYNDYLAKLRNYSVYDETDKTIKYYEENEYPGNEKYVQNLKDAYKDSKDNIQKYIDGIKNDVNTDDIDLSALNENLVTEGEKTIANIDKRLEKLDTITEDAYSKGKEEFIRLVNDTTKLEDETKSEFNKVLEEVNKKLDIDIKNN